MNRLSLCHYPSLLVLPWVRVDQHGNLNFVSIADRTEGLRPRFERLMNIGLQSLKSTKLNELLDWVMWGAETGVMWECTAVELSELIGYWEKANPKAGAK